MVMDHASGDWQKNLAGALDWWREAGVDLSFADEARSWIAAPVEPDQPASTAAAAPIAPPEPRRLIGGYPAGWPQDLAAFAAWWLGEATLDPGPPNERVPPRGSPGAELMLLVEHPEREDRERLLSGSEGALLDAFLKAAGIEPESAYVASALPRCTPLPDWNALKREGLGAVVAHHVALVRPKRLILFGNAISSLLDHDPTQTAQFLPLVNHEGETVPVLVAPSLRLMLARPARKAALWQRWLDWTG